MLTTRNLTAKVECITLNFINSKAIMYKHHYDILGIGMDATAREILLAFRRLARRYHPDVNRGDLQSLEIFNQISNAYRLLSNSDRRKEYDLLGNAVESPLISKAPHVTTDSEPNLGTTTVRRDKGPLGTGVDDLIQSVMDWGRDSSRSTVEELFQRQRIDIPVSISLEQAYSGTRFSIRIDSPSIPGGSYPQEIQIVIPPGIADGSRIHVARETGQRGTVDVYGLITVQPHKWYWRKGNDLFIKLPIHFAEMILGAQLRLSLLSGNEFTFGIPQGTQSGQALKIRGMGMPRVNAPHLRGDLLIEVEAILPSSVDDDEEALLRQVHDLWKAKSLRGLEVPRHAGPSSNTRAT